MSDLESLRRKVDRGLSSLRVAREKLKTEKEARGAIVERLRVLEEAQSLTQSVAEEVQSRVHRELAKVVSRCLEIFESPYEFQIKVTRARGKTEARLVFVRDGLEVDPVDGAGGGVLDVAAFALRVACLVIRRPPLRRVLFLDEPMKWVSEGYRPRVRELFESLSKELGIQFVIVTHIPELQTGTVVSLPE